MKENVFMVELNQQEMGEVNGGGLWKEVVKALIASYEMASDFKEGWDSVPDR